MSFSVCKYDNKITIIYYSWNENWETIQKQIFIIFAVKISVGKPATQRYRKLSRRMISI